MLGGNTVARARALRLPALRSYISVVGQTHSVKCTCAILINVGDGCRFSPHLRSAAPAGVARARLKPLSREGLGDPFRGSSQMQVRIPTACGLNPSRIPHRTIAGVATRRAQNLAVRCAPPPPRPALPSSPAAPTAEAAEPLLPLYTRGGGELTCAQRSDPARNGVEARGCGW